MERLFEVLILEFWNFEILELKKLELKKFKFPLLFKEGPMRFFEGKMHQGWLRGSNHPALRSAAWAPLLAMQGGEIYFLFSTSG